MKDLRSSRRFLLLWVLGFLSFPIAGLLALFVVPVDTPVRALIAGAIAGAALGLIQWLILRSRVPSLSLLWVAATSLGMAVGLAIGTTFLGSETGGSELLWRGGITGLCIGIAQGVVFQRVLPVTQATIWIGVVSLGWALGWFVTRSAGIDLSQKWYVFGASGALTFQVLTGLALFFLLRSAKELRPR